MIATIVVLVVLGVIIEPLILIWALNTLFSLGIEFTFWNWLAAFALSAIIIGPSRVKK